MLAGASIPMETKRNSDCSIIAALFIFFLMDGYADAQTQTADVRDPYRYSQISPSMAVIIVVLIAALFIIGFFSIYIRQCSDSESNGAGRLLGQSNGGRSRTSAARGLDRAVIDTFPTLMYSVVKSHKIGKGALECAVCLNEFEDDELLRMLPKCDHVFHPECIDAWLASHTTCPVCRANLSLENQNLLPANQESSVHGSDHGSDQEPQLRSAEEELPVNDVAAGTGDRDRGGRSRPILKFPRSHSTGHSLVQPGADTERFTLRLPDEIRKQIMNQELNRTMSMVMLPRLGSSKRGYRIGGEEGSSRGKHFPYKRLDRGGDRDVKSDRWSFRPSPFLVRASSFLTRSSPTVKSPKVAAVNDSFTFCTTSVNGGAEPVALGRLPV